MATTRRTRAPKVEVAVEAEVVQEPVVEEEQPVVEEEVAAAPEPVVLGFDGVNPVSIQNPLPKQVSRATVVQGAVFGLDGVNPVSVNNPPAKAQ